MRSKGLHTRVTEHPQRVRQQHRGALATTCACRATDASASTKLLLNDPMHISTTPASPPTNCRLHAAAAHEMTALTASAKRRAGLRGDRGAGRRVKSAHATCRTTTTTAAATASYTSRDTHAHQDEQYRARTVGKREHMQSGHFGGEARAVGSSKFARSGSLERVTAAGHAPQVTLTRNTRTEHVATRAPARKCRGGMEGGERRGRRRSKMSSKDTTAAPPPASMSCVSNATQDCLQKGTVRDRLHAEQSVTRHLQTCRAYLA
jgi:hypothetical protein